VKRPHITKTSLYMSPKRYHAAKTTRCSTLNTTKQHDAPGQEAGTRRT
jgi:hypothetical protein